MKPPDCISRRLRPLHGNLHHFKGMENRIILACTKHFHIISTILELNVVAEQYKLYFVPECYKQ